jgi:Mrp family chromosome partitioning ATPase
MSRNFELLQRLDRERGLAQEPTEEMGAAAAAPALDLGREPAPEDLSRLVLANAPAIAPSGKRPEVNVDRMMREELVKLAQRLFLLPGAFHSVVFAGVDQENGCGRICAQVGEILDSQAPRSVCLVDCNFPTPSLHDYFGIENQGGITDAVLQPGSITDFAHRLRGANLWLVPAGQIGTDWPALVNSERMRIRLHELTQLYDHVLVNAPPAAAYVDAMHLGKLVDGMVVVLQANATRREAARKLKHDMQAARVRLLGAVLNEREFPIPNAIYSRL